ncbi:MAG: hypothetical protein R2729_22135 [Bryobacteraceae bacterium]
MLSRTLLATVALCAPALSATWVLIRTVDGARIEGQTSLRAIGAAPVGKVLSFHSGAPASEEEKARIASGLAAIQGQDRAARDSAVEELTAIGLPVVTPLLETLKDTDQHEPRPLYRLFERLIPPQADGFDRTLALVRLVSGDGTRMALPAGSIDVRTAAGETTTLPWSKIRSLAVRQARVAKKFAIHSLKHSTQIEYLDTGLVLGAGARLDVSARGFARLSWNTDSWASGPNGLTKPGSPAYKSHLVDGQPFGALVGRVGAAGAVFFVGEHAAKTGLEGRLQLAINDNRHWQNNLGGFVVTLAAADAYDTGEPQ